MTVFDKEWVDGDDSAMVDEALMEMRDRLVVAMGNVQKALEDVYKKYEGGGFYSTEDRTFMDYFEGQVCAYEHAIAIVEGRE